MGTRQETLAAALPKDWVCEDFLELVWGDEKGWVSLPSKVGIHWNDLSIEWPPYKDRDTIIIEGAIHDREDLYYSVCKFKRKGRRIGDVMPTDWLWADLDEIHPSAATELGFMPTVAVESSPGRYQALWKLNRRLKPSDTEKINQALSYKLGADKGGWDLTQVLRIPGTRNFKYRGAPPVKLLWEEDLVYDPKDIWASVRGVVSTRAAASVDQSSVARRPIPARARRLLAEREAVQGERSDRLWELNCLLAESGRGAEEIFELVVPSVWNKWPDRPDRLRGDIQKAIRQVEGKVRVVEGGTGAEGKVEAEGRAPFVAGHTFLEMQLAPVEWLIEDIWTVGSHGLIAGEPKTNKTTLALALSVAVASGRPFLGRYPVKQGPVLFVQEENARNMMQDRMKRLVNYMEADASDLDIRILNRFGFNLNLEEHRDMLQAEIEAERPSLLVLDPMYLVFGGVEENSAASLQPFLSWLLKVSTEYSMAVILVHHFRKAPTQRGAPYQRPGQRMRGSAILHGWVDNALYLEPLEEPRRGWVKCRIEREFRQHEPQKPMELAMSLGTGSAMMQCEFGEKSIEHVIAEVVREQNGISYRTLGQILEMDHRTVLARCRGSELFDVSKGEAGRNNGARVYLKGTMNGA